mgnify:CR=1 FL=1
MSDTSPAIPESIDPANQHKALTAGQQAVIKKLFRRLIVFLFVLFIFSFLDRINIGFAGLTMGRDLGLSATMFGLATTLFYAAYVIFGIPSNIMLSIVGARRWIATIMVLWGIASTATMFATGPTSLYVLRILVGITEAGFLPGILLYLTFWFPAYFRARANALFMVAMPVTTALGSIVSGYILSLDGVMALKGWQWLFLLFPGTIGLFLCVMIRSILFSVRGSDMQLLLDDYPEMNVLIPGIAMLCIGMMIAAAKMVQKLTEESNRRIETEIYQSRIRELEEHIGDMEGLYEGIQGMRHDMKNYIADMDALMKQNGKENGQEALRQYLDSLQQSVDQIRQEKGCSVDELFREVFRYAE